MKISISFKLELYWILLGLFSVLGIILFLVLYYCGITFSVSDVVTYFTGIVAIITLIYYATNIDKEQNYHNENLRISRYHYGYDAISKYHEPHMTEALRVLKDFEINKHKHCPNNSGEEIKLYLEKNLTERQQIISVLNYFEHLCILIDDDQIESSIVKDNFKNVMIDTYVSLKPFIKLIQDDDANDALKHFSKWVVEWQKP